MKRFTTIVACICGAIALAATAATYKIASLPTKGEHRAPGVSLAKPLHVEAYGILPTTGTVIIYQVIDGIATNTIYSGTATNGVLSEAITTTNYFAAGDTLIRDGTATNGSVRLIFSGD